LVSTTKSLLLFDEFRESFALEDVKVDMTVTFTNVFDCVSESFGLVLPDIEDDTAAVALGAHALDRIELFLRDAAFNEDPGSVYG